MSNDSNCALAVADTKKNVFISNLTPGVKPIATKSRRFNETNRGCIQKTFDEWLKERIIQPSSSLWQAQIVIKNELNLCKKQLCTDYLQTINIYTELDVYPLPRIDDMIDELSKHKLLSTFDLRTAYHQISLIEFNCKYK